jgi:hypothetical protein
MLDKICHISRPKWAVREGYLAGGTFPTYNYGRLLSKCFFAPTQHAVCTISRHVPLWITVRFGERLAVFKRQHVTNGFHGID